MWKRSTKPEAEATPGLGIGVQVYVREPDAPGGEDWVGEPTGVIVAPASPTLRGVNLPAGDGTLWQIAFSTPQHRRDGRGPYERASIPQRLLVAADPIED